MTVALPPVAGIALETVLALNEKLAARGQLQTSRIFQVTIGFFLVVESVLATLSGTHISPPAGLTCGLSETWERLFDKRKAKCVEQIQDAFSCCGFSSPDDMAYPFPNATMGSDACVVKYGRDKGCLEPWKEEERKVAVMLLVVPVAVFIWMVRYYRHRLLNMPQALTHECQVAIILAPSSKSSWLPSHFQLPSESSQNGTPPERGPIPSYVYRDVEDPGESDSLQREVTNLNKQSQLASHVERSRTKSGGRLSKVPRWREEAGVAD